MKKTIVSRLVYLDSLIKFAEKVPEEKRWFNSLEVNTHIGDQLEIWNKEKKALENILEYGDSL